MEKERESELVKFVCVAHSALSGTLIVLSTHCALRLLHTQQIRLTLEYFGNCHYTMFITYAIDWILACADFYKLYTAVQRGGHVCQAFFGIAILCCTIQYSQI